MKALKDLLYGVSIDSVIGSTALRVSQIQYDSRLVGKKSVFIALRGQDNDGHDYIESAIDL